MIHSKHKMTPAILPCYLEVQEDIFKPMACKHPLEIEASLINVLQLQLSQPGESE
jgi:hypothetical protein